MFRMEAKPWAGGGSTRTPWPEASSWSLPWPRPLRASWPWNGAAAHPGEREWLEAHLLAYRERLAADPVTALLIRAALGVGTHWIADFLTPAPAGEATFVEELAEIRRTPPETAQADLTASLGGPLPTELHRSDLPERTADLLEWVWTEAVLPYWPRRRRIIEADVIARTAQLGRSGWAAALVPVTPNQRWVSWDAPRRYAVVYTCSGALSEPDRASVPEPLGRLLGPARASILVLLDTRRARHSWSP